MGNKHSVLWMLVGVGLIVAFLAGFVPQYKQAEKSTAELELLRKRVESLESAAKMDRLRSAASRIFVEVTKKNYGSASTEASEFFNQVTVLQRENQNTPLKPGLDAIASQRDTIVANLTKPEPAVQDQVRDILERLLPPANR